MAFESAWGETPDKGMALPAVKYAWARRIAAGDMDLQTTVFAVENVRRAW
jgi:hypothetical protein